MAIGENGEILGQVRTLFAVGAIGDLSDGQLLERFATGRGEAAELAFAALVERHGAMVLRVCRGALVEPHDAEDAFQATFLVLVKRARSLWVRDSLGPWLHQVAYRTASCLRSSIARRRRLERGTAATSREPHDATGDVTWPGWSTRNWGDSPRGIGRRRSSATSKGAATSRRRGTSAGRSGRSRAG